MVNMYPLVADMSTTQIMDRGGEIPPASDVHNIKSANPQLLTKNPFVPNGENTP
jgi:hypothetical protein